jgi:hypothetical protein
MVYTSGIARKFSESRLRRDERELAVYPASFDASHPVAKLTQGKADALVGCVLVYLTLHFKGKYTSIPWLSSLFL